MTTQTLNLNMIPGGVMPVVYASQYDVQTDAIIFKLYNGTTAFSIPSGSSVIVQGTKPDVKGFSYAASSYSGNTVTLSVYIQMTAVAGDVKCELRITRGSQDVGSCNFILRVEPSVLDDAVISETDLPLIQQAAEISATIQEYASAVAQAATDAAASATAAATSEAAAEMAAESVEELYDSIETAKTNANTAAQAATDAADAISNISATANTLSAGTSATASYNSSTNVFTFGIPRGATGESGVTAPLTGFFTMWVDIDGNLYCAAEDDMSDYFYYDTDTGNLYYLTEDGN